MPANLLEIHTALDSLSDADYRALTKYASQCIFHYDLDREGVTKWDLLNEAVEKTLVGDRNWDPIKVPFLPFLCGVMKSIASNQIHTATHHRPFQIGGSDAEAVFNRLASPSATPEIELAEKQELETPKRLLAQIEHAIGKDPEVALLFELKMAGLKGPAIQNKLKWSKKQFVTIDRRYRRLIDNLKDTVRHQGDQA